MVANESYIYQHFLNIQCVLPQVQQQVLHDVKRCQASMTCTGSRLAITGVGSPSARRYSYGWYCRPYWPRLSQEIVTRVQVWDIGGHWWEEIDPHRRRLVAVKQSCACSSLFSFIGSARRWHLPIAIWSSQLTHSIWNGHHAGIWLPGKLRHGRPWGLQ